MLLRAVYILLFFSVAALGQQASLRTNFGLNTWDYHLGPASTLNADQNRLALQNFKELSVWDLEHFVVLKNISLQGRIKIGSLHRLFQRKTLNLISGIQINQYVIGIG